MYKIPFTEEEIKELEYLRYNATNSKVQKRSEAIWLRSQGFKQKEIIKICKISPPTYSWYVNLYKEGGIEA